MFEKVVISMFEKVVISMFEKVVISIFEELLKQYRVINCEIESIAYSYHKLKSIVNKRVIDQYTGYWSIILRNGLG